MAVPKKKTSKARTTRRHKAYQTKQRNKLTNNLALADCQNCGSKHRAHHVCSNCGFYKGEQVFNKLDQELDKVTKIKA